MTDELRAAIENLYTTFAVYPCKPTMAGCPCCVSNSDKEKIHSKELRQLNGDDLARYSFKAMTTWGDTDDFKHYLPRIFELLATTDFTVDTFIVSGKLDYGKWRSWIEGEQEAITAFLLAWWTDSIKNKSSFDKEIFMEIYKSTNNIDQLLDRWKINFDDNSFRNFVELIYDYYNDLTNKRKEFRELDEASVEKLIRWIQLNSEKLASGFFYFEVKDKELAEKASITESMVERTV